jgi:ketosteroid isomerase-like protein
MSDAHEQIRNLLARYCERMDAGDFGGLAELFAGATLADESGNVFATGADEMRVMWERQTILYDGKPRTKHVTANPVISIDGDEAACTSSYVVFQGTDDLPLQPIVTGRYADTFARDDAGQWRFTQRRYAIDHVRDLSRHLRR